MILPQVTEVFSKEAGIYARFAIMRMAQMGYQTRAGILTAGQYGAPQVRCAKCTAQGGRVDPPFASTSGGGTGISSVVRFWFSRACHHYQGPFTHLFVGQSCA